MCVGTDINMKKGQIRMERKREITHSLDQEKVDSTNPGVLYASRGSMIGVNINNCIPRWPRIHVQTMRTDTAYRHTHRGHERQEEEVVEIS